MEQVVVLALLVAFILTATVAAFAVWKVFELQKQVYTLENDAQINKYIYGTVCDERDSLIQQLRVEQRNYLRLKNSRKHDTPQSTAQPLASGPGTSTAAAQQQQPAADNNPPQTSGVQTSAPPQQQQVQQQQPQARDTQAPVPNPAQPTAPTVSPTLPSTLTPAPLPSGDTPKPPQAKKKTTQLKNKEEKEQEPLLLDLLGLHRSEWDTNYELYGPNSSPSLRAYSTNKTTSTTKRTATPRKPK